MKIILLFIASLLLVLSFLEVFFKAKFSKESRWYVLIYIGLCIAVVAFTGFRPLGIDKDGLMYHREFKEICSYSYEQILLDNPHRIKEIGYLLLNKLFCAIGFREMLVCVALLSLLPKQYVLYRYTAYPFLSLLVYLSMFYLLRDFTQIRDAISISFVIISFLLFYYKKIAWGILFLCLGSMFHFVALMFIPIILFSTYVKNIKYYYLIIIFSLILFSFKGIRYIKYIEFFPNRLSMYNEVEGGGSLSIVAFCALSVMMYYILGRRGKELEWLHRITLLTIGTGFALYHHPVLFRLPSALAFFSILLYGNTLSEMKISEKGISYILGMVLIIYFGIKSLSITHL